MAIPSDTLRLTGLDTLSERALRRLTDRWTGELYPLDSLDVQPAGEVASPQTFMQIVEGWQRAREMYHDADVESVLGGGSTLSHGVSDMSNSVAMLSAEVYNAEVMLSGAKPLLSAGWIDELYNVLVVLMFVYYLFCICRYFDDIRVLLGSIFNSKVSSAGRVGERLRSDIFYGALGKLFMLGACFVGLIAAISISRTDIALPEQVMTYLPVAVVGVFLAIIILQYLLLGLVGVVTQSYGDVAKFIRIRLTYFVLTTVLASPVILMALVGTGASADAWLKVSVVVLGVVAILFIKESIGFFISKKVSILHWILYLCTVEILPLSLLWQAVIRLR